MTRIFGSGRGDDSWSPRGTLEHTGVHANLEPPTPALAFIQGCHMTHATQGTRLIGAYDRTATHQRPASRLLGRDRARVCDPPPLHFDHISQLVKVFPERRAGSSPSSSARATRVARWRGATSELAHSSLPRALLSLQRAIKLYDSSEHSRRETLVAAQHCSCTGTGCESRPGARGQVFPARLDAECPGASISRRGACMSLSRRAAQDTTHGIRVANAAAWRSALVTV